MSSPNSKLLSHLQLWREEPIVFFREALGVHGIWSGMEEMARSVVDHRQTAIAGCHNSSKTYCAACLALWWVICWNDAVVYATSPKEEHLRDTFWAQLTAVYNRATVPLGGLMTSLNWRGTNGSVIVGRTSRKDSGEAGATAMQGYKSLRLLMLFDEASAIDRPFWRSADGVVTFPENRWVAMANPTDPASAFAECWRRDSGWNTVNLDALQNPNLVAGRIVHPYLATPEWVESIKSKYGEGSAYWEARVRGRFPSSAINTLVTMQDIENACDREPPKDNTALISIGVDVARFGDDLTCIFVVAGGEILHSESYQGQDTVFTAGRVIDIAKHFGLAQDAAPRIAIDDTGVGGGVTDNLTACGWMVNAENFGAVAVDEEGFKNRRTELWLSMRDWLIKESTLSTASKETREGLEADLPGVTYKYMPDSRYLLEPKADMKKRFGHSPDNGDALVLALAWRTRAMVSLPSDDDWREGEVEFEDYVLARREGLLD